MLVLPIVLNLVVITLANKPNTYKVLFVVEEKTDLTERISDRFEEKYTVIFEENMEQAIKLVNDGQVDYVVVLEKTFMEDVKKGTAKVRTYCRSQEDRLKPVSLYVDNYFEQVNDFGRVANGNEETFYQLFDRFEAEIVKANYTYCNRISFKNVDNAISSLGYVAVGMVYFITFSTMLLFEDKKCGVYERVNGTPMGRMSYFFQHFISYILFAALQSAIMICVMPNVVDVWCGNGLPQKLKLFLVCMVFAGACISIGIAVSTFSKNTIMANSIVSLINVPMLMLGGCFFPASFMPENIQKISRFMPTTWFLQAAKGVLQKKDYIEYLPSILLLIGLSLILMVLSSIATKTE